MQEVEVEESDFIKKSELKIRSEKVAATLLLHVHFLPTRRCSLTVRNSAGNVHRCTDKLRSGHCSVAPTLVTIAPILPTGTSSLSLFTSATGDNYYGDYG